MRDTVLELVGIVAALAALVTFVVAAWILNPVAGLFALGLALTVVAVVLIGVANVGKGRKP